MALHTAMVLLRPLVSSLLSRELKSSSHAAKEEHKQPAHASSSSLAALIHEDWFAVCLHENVRLRRAGTISPQRVGPQLPTRHKIDAQWMWEEKGKERAELWTDCVPPKSIHWSPNPLTVISDMRSWGWRPMTGLVPYKGIKRPELSLPTARRWPSISQEESPHLPVLAPWSCTFSLQICEKEMLVSP